MLTSEVKLSRIEDRIDAEYYKPEYLNVEKLLFTSPTLVESVKISKLRKDPIKDPDRKFHYLEIDNIDLQTGETWPQEFYGHKAPSRARKGVTLGDSIISTVRPNRNAVGFITEELKDCICSTGFAVLHPEKLLPGYLFAFLKSRYAINQIVRLTTAAMYPAVSGKDLSTIKIPIPPKAFQEKIEKMVKEAHQKRKLANEKYKEAEELLEKELGLENLDLSTERTYETNYQKIKDRLDQEYYQPKYEKLRDALIKKKKYKSVRLGDIAQEIKYGTSEKVIYIERGVPFLRVTDIDNFYTIQLEAGKFISHYVAERLKEYRVKKNDLLISRSGTLGSVVYINDELSDSIFGSYFIKVSLKSSSLDPFFISIFLNSRFGKIQSEELGSGAIQTNLTINAIESLLVPVLPKPKQEKITDLIKEAFKLRKESKQLIQEAKRKVEKMILGNCNISRNISAV